MHPSPTGRHTTHKPLMCRKSLVLKGFTNSTATFCCYRQRDGRDGEVPLFKRPQGLKNLYYKRMVPLELRGAGRPAQIWRSLKTADRKRAYAATHAEIELLFAQERVVQGIQFFSG